MAEQITTVADMAALPEGSVVLDRDGTPALVVPAVGGPNALVRAVMGDNLSAINSLVMDHLSPFRVIYRPDRDLLAEAQAEGARAEREQIVAALRSRFGVTNRAADWLARSEAGADR